MTLKSKDSASIVSAKHRIKKTKRKAKKSRSAQNQNIKDNSIKDHNEIGPHYDFNYTDPNICDRISARDAVFRNNKMNIFPENDRLIPIRFIYPQPEGMPRKIRNLNDIQKLNEDEVKIFLRGYGEKIDADIHALKSRLAVSLGVPQDIANETFNLIYPPVLCAKSKEELIEKLGRFKDDIGPLYDFNYTEPTIGGRILHKQRIFSNNYFRCFAESRMLLPIRFIYPQPEGMPRKIRNLNDIKQLNENEVKIFLRGYGEDTNGDIYALKRKLAMSVGVPPTIAYNTFKENYPLISNNHSEDSEDSESSDDYIIILN